MKNILLPGLDKRKIINVEKAKKILSETGATCSIVYIGSAYDQLWDKKHKHRVYDVELSSPKGNMKFKYWDTLNNTRISKMSLKDAATVIYSCPLSELTAEEQNALREKLEQIKTAIIPTEYDVIHALQKSDVGSFEEFCKKNRYIKNEKSQEVYQAVVDEYTNLCKVFSQDQIAELAKL